MANEDLQVDLRCQSELHYEHLCYLTSQGFHLTDEQEYKSLTDRPAFRCGRCGRKANGGQNLCVPIGLGGSKYSNCSVSNIVA